MFNRLQSTASSAKARGLETLDARLPPQRRQELYQRLQTWAHENPKLAAFVAAHIFCSVPPILLFLTYIAALLLASTFAALTLALVFVGISTAVACLVLVPVLFVTSVSATGFFVAGYVALRLMQRFKAVGESTDTSSSNSAGQSQPKVNGDKNEASSGATTNGLMDSILAHGHSVQSRSSANSGAATPTSRVSSSIQPLPAPSPSQDGETAATTGGEVKQEMVERKSGLWAAQQGDNNYRPVSHGDVRGGSPAAVLHSRPALF